MVEPHTCSNNDNSNEHKIKEKRHSTENVNNNKVKEQDKQTTTKKETKGKRKPKLSITRNKSQYAVLQDDDDDDDDEEEIEDGIPIAYSCATKELNYRMRDDNKCKLNNKYKSMEADDAYGNADITFSVSSL